MTQIDKLILSQRTSFSWLQRDGAGLNRTHAQLGHAIRPYMASCSVLPRCELSGKLTMNAAPSISDHSNSDNSKRGSPLVKRLMNHTTWQRQGHADDNPTSPFHVLGINDQDRSVSGSCRVGGVTGITSDRSNGSILSRLHDLPWLLALTGDSSA